MAVDKGLMNFTVYRQDEEEFFLTFVDGEDNPIDLAATYDEILLECRTYMFLNKNNEVVKSLSLSAGDIVISDTNKITFNLKTSFNPGTYSYDMRFRYIGTTRYKTLIAGGIIVQPNTGDIS